MSTFGAVLLLVLFILTITGVFLTCIEKDKKNEDAAEKQWELTRLAAEYDRIKDEDYDRQFRDLGWRGKY